MMSAADSLHRCFIALGSNLGDTRQHLARLRAEIADRIGEIVRSSRVITTKPEGFESDHLFSNQVLEVHTALTPWQLLTVSQEIEREMGRHSKSHAGEYTDRVADIDLILYEDLIINEGSLKVPHPRYRERSFVMEPLCEIAPDVTDPISGDTMKVLCDHLHLQYR